MTKNLILLILSLLFLQTVKAQQTINVPTSGSTKNTDTLVFAAVEKEPEFSKGGSAGFNMFLYKTIRFPATVRERGLSGKVIVTFVVEKDGTLSHLKTLRSPDPAMSEAAEQAIAQSPPWTPGMQNGQPVRVQYTISFAFSFASN